jgi:hypothetical protein
MRKRKRIMLKDHREHVACPVCGRSTGNRLGLCSRCTEPTPRPHYEDEQYDPLIDGDGRVRGYMRRMHVSLCEQ